MLIGTTRFGDMEINPASLTVPLALRGFES